MCSSLTFLLRFFRRRSRTLSLDMVGDVDVGVGVVSVGCVELDEFGGSMGGGEYPNEELIDSYSPIETYLSIMT